MNIYEQVKEAVTPEEMRAELFRLTYHDNLVKAVWDLAEYRGLSAEDKYTILAYEAVKIKTDLQKKLLDSISYSQQPSPWFCQFKD